MSRLVLCSFLCLLLIGCSDSPGGHTTYDLGGPDLQLSDSTQLDGAGKTDGPLLKDDLGQPDAQVKPDAAAPDAAAPDAAQPDAFVPDAYVVDAYVPDASKKQICDKLNTDYKTELTKARACNPALSVIECDTKVDDSLDCPCSTYVNKKNAAALAQLQALKSQFTALGCSKLYACPPVTCPVPSQACMATTGGQGECMKGPS